MKKREIDGFGPNLFDEWRSYTSTKANPAHLFDDPLTKAAASNRKPNPDFVLNQPRYQGASILLARKNFGCGSSREHAPMGTWTNLVFAPSWHPALPTSFSTTASKTACCPSSCPKPPYGPCCSMNALAFPGYQLTVDLERQVVVRPQGEEIPFRGASLSPLLPDERLGRHWPDPETRKTKFATFEAARLAAKALAGAHLDRKLPYENCSSAW